MKIKAGKGRSQTFKNVEIGECFEKTGSFYMKVFDCKSSSLLCNAVNLSNGMHVYFEKDDRVFLRRDLVIVSEKPLNEHKD